jgi:hypothetical protein
MWIAVTPIMNAFSEVTAMKQSVSNSHRADGVIREVILI